MQHAHLSRITLASVVAICAIAVAVQADEPLTPAPAVAPAPGCAGNAAMSWKVATIAGADSIQWELRRGSDFLDPVRADRRSVTGTGNGTSGIVVLDLRDLGPILNGEPYFMRIVAIGGGQEVARRSPSVRFDPQQVYDDFQATAGGGLTLSLTWGGSGQFAGCLDSVFYELKQGAPFANPTSSESGRLAGEAIPQTAGNRTVDLQPYGPGTYYVRVVGKYGGTTPDDDVGRRGPGIQVAVGLGSTPTPTPTPTLTPTVPFTPTFTPTLAVTPTPSYTPTFAPPTATYTPSYTPTTPPPVQTAPPDPNFNNPLNIPLDNTVSVLDFVSYPQGDTTDRVRWDITGMNPNSSLPGGRARLIITLSCFGTGTQNVELFTGGQTYSCGQTVVDTEVTASSTTGQVTITAVGGTGTYVQWVLTGTATRLNRPDPGRGIVGRPGGGG